jgi:aryl-alcohol dehydrogenase-like predicted oxidoreductase
MKALGIADRAGATRFISQRIHYTLNAREAEYEPRIAVDQGIGTLVWCPLAGGLLSGECQRGAQGLTMPTMAEVGTNYPLAVKKHFMTS